MVLSFSGIVIITYGEDKQDEETQDVDTTKGDSYKLGVVLCLLMCLLFSLNATTTRRLRELHFTVIQFYIAIAALIVSSIWLLIEQRDRKAFDISGLKVWTELICASAFHFFAQMTATCMC